jgi:Ca-activated chloride channel family protein
MKSFLKTLAPVLWTFFFLVPSLLLAVIVIELHYGVALMEGSFRFERPLAAILLLGPVLVLVARGYLHARTAPRLRVSRGAELATVAGGKRIFFAHAPTGLRTSLLTLAVLALMGPQSIHARDRTDVEGIDLVLVLDLSRSMEATDIEPNRFEAMKSVVAEFVARRPNDRIGAVVFGREAFTLLPLTTDKEALMNVVRELSLDVLDGRGTAIGNAVATGLSRLRRSRAESKVIILLTDGDSNAGNVSPEQAAELATAMRVRMYTILIGAEDGRSNDPLRMLQGGAMPVNPELLRSMAQRTNGEYFGVSDRRSLESSFHTILDRLERSEIEDLGRTYGEVYPAFVGPAIILLVLELMFATLIVRRWP